MTEQARDTEALIRDQIAKHAVLLYMKGTPQFPQCGFSARAVEALSQIGRPFAYVNILENQDIRAIAASSIASTSPNGTRINPSTRGAKPSCTFLLPVAERVARVRPWNE